MTDKLTDTLADNPADDPEIPNALVRPHERISMIWLLPVLTLILGAWLLYKSQTDAAIPVQIHFTDGQGLVAGETEVRYQGIAIGVIKKFSLDSNLNGVTATVSFDHTAETLLRAGTQFWLVKPQVSLQGISGLDTLLGGNYISLRLGEGAPSDRFEALSEPPPLGKEGPGLNIRLRADSLGSIQYGSPLYYKQLQVGDIQGYELTEDGQGVLIDINVRKQFVPLVRGNSRFWNNSGLRLKGNLAGLSLQTDSLTSLFIGGISFDTPTSDPPAPAPDTGKIYTLHDDYESADTGVWVRVGFDSAEGLEAGVTPVIFKGLTLGTLTEIRLDPPHDRVLGTLRLTPEAEARLNENTRFWLVKPRLSVTGISGLENLIKGNQIRIDFRPGEQAPHYDFDALPDPPALAPGDPGLQLTLNASTLGSLQQGSGVYFRKLQIGEVQDYALSTEGKQVKISISIRAQYASLIRANSRFWNNSGIRVKGGLSGFSVQSDTLSSLLIGGINVDLGPAEKPGAETKDGDAFPLFNDFDAAQVGDTIRISFPSAEGLKPGVTQVQLKGIKVGTLTALEIAPDLDDVVALVKLSPLAVNALNLKTRFWKVKPLLGPEGISGLETLINGNYIQMDIAPGKGHPRQFGALEEPPALDASAPGLHLTLITADAEGLTRGTPIYYRQIQVGSLQSVTLIQGGQQIAVGIHIQRRYASLVNRDSRFWNSSGFSAQAGLKGLTIEAAPLRALLLGGISFDNPDAANAPLVVNGAQLPLYPDRDAALARGTLIQIDFASAEGLTKDGLLRFQGLDIGRITGIRLEPDSHRVTVSALVYSAYQPLLREGSDFWVVKPRLGLTGAEHLDTLMGGSYIQLKPGAGAARTRFTGLEREPFLVDAGSGTGFILESPTLGSLQQGSPVYFRQIPVGRVAGFGLSDDARQVEIHISIESDYAPLVREDSRFWNVSGIEMDINLLGGSKLRTESVESILAGGIALATPDTQPLTTAARQNRRFTLHPRARDEWLRWAPRIPLTLSD
ncbi:MAG: paraquat-inducible protein B [Motiliproteus sp.]|jgi:paraquat-inducible protein B